MATGSPSACRLPRSSARVFRGKTRFRRAAAAAGRTFAAVWRRRCLARLRLHGMDALYYYHFLPIPRVSTTRVRTCCCARRAVLLPFCGSSLNTTDFSPFAGLKLSQAHTTYFRFAYAAPFCPAVHNNLVAYIYYSLLRHSGYILLYYGYTCFRHTYYHIRMDLPIDTFGSLFMIISQ